MLLHRLLTESWRKRNFLTIVLYPFSCLYYLAMQLHRLAYALGLKKTYSVAVPVVVVGNLTVGGSGKTPLVIYLIEGLRAAGFKPGVVSRGYAGEEASYPLRVTPMTPVEQSGDEPAMIVQRTGVAMVVGPERRDNIELLLAREDCDIVISDDGLQHWALAQDVKICIVDKTLNEQNAHLLPAGPYREPASNLARMDIVVEHVSPDSFLAKPQQTDNLQMVLTAEAARPVLKAEPMVEFNLQQPVHAVAAIGKPQRFFDTCKKLGLKITQHTFPDHHYFSPADISFDDDLNVLMTEKDAIKCQQIADSRHWYLPVNAKLNQDIVAMITTVLKHT